MDKNENDFVVLKKYESPMQSSIHGDMIQLYQLCQNTTDKSHYYTYEVLDNEGGIIGGRLTYQFKDPNKALEQWDNYINGELEGNNDFKVTKQEFFQNKKLRF